ncbi:GMP synthase (glutamine-hydrolyzing) [Bertholletia excelsa]
MDAQAVKTNLVLNLDFGSQYTHLITRRIRSLSVFSLCISGTSSLKTIADLNPRGFVEYVESNGVFVLGICYGLQLIVQRLGGEVRVGRSRSTGGWRLRSRGLVDFLEANNRQVVWMSHGDEAARLPAGFEVVARSQQGSVAAVENPARRFTGFSIIPRHGGPDEHVICALSGGVDSTVAATLVHKAIGERLHCIFVDNGPSFTVTCVDATEQFLSKLKGVVDPEMKRKIIGKEFICTFDAFAQDLERKLGKKPAYLVQGTLYPDVIESCPPPGRLPKDMKLKLIEPLKLLFKDEVRELGRILEVPAAFLKRHPFPGLVDEIFIQSIKDAGIYDSIWQAFAVFLPIRSVGVQGDQRTHSHVVALRAVTSQDGMTADWYNFEHKFLDDVARKICNSVRGVNRVVQDITSKPPSTIEWE